MHNISHKIELIILCILKKMILKIISCIMGKPFKYTCGNSKYACLTSQATMFQSCQDGSTIFLVFTLWEESVYLNRFSHDAADVI